MNGNICLLRNGKDLVAMHETKYDSESLLQKLLADLIMDVGLTTD